MRRFFRIINGLLIVILIIVLADVGLVMSFANTRPELKQADAAIVLGAAIGSPAAYNRALEAVVLIDSGKIDTVVVTGGKIADRDQSEAEYMAKVIRAQVASQQPTIILESESRSTYENIKNAKAKIPESESVVIVSDEFHLARGVMLAKRAGFETVYWTAPEPTYYQKGELTWYYLREFAAMISYIPHFIGN